MNTTTPPQTSSQTAQQTASQAEKQAIALGLLTEEFAHICTSLSRLPNQPEIGIFAAMWSEHCSYKSTRHLLKTLPTEGTAVIAGPGENAGVVDIGDGMAAVFKIESHNHPSFISPYQGAATGVGGILRDIFTMGARPVALLNALHFGDPHHRLTPHFLTQVVAGIGGYGNAIGIPTIGGASHFSLRYNNNILVNAMAVGIAKHEAIFRSAARGVGNLVVYIGAKTGRDGIQGASMASAELSSGSDANTSKRPSVQIGDPLLGKLVMEACLELMQKGLVLAAQDMGAAGLTSSSVEMASKGGVGVRLMLDKVPVRETNMTAQEIMLSESQERMLLVLSPDALDAAAKCLAHWEVDFAVIGAVTKTQTLQAEYHGTQVIDLPIELIAHGCPPSPTINMKANPNPAPKPPAPSATIQAKATTLPLTQALKALLASPALGDRSWIYQQYDRHVMADTALASGESDAAVVRIHGTKRAIALTTDCTHRYVEADPYWGAALAVAEAQRNISAVGATPVAVTNNLNFGNPYKPEIMGELTSAVMGLGDACRAFDLPVVSGNVSLHNETDGKAIAPTPVIGMLGVLEDVMQATPLAINKSGLTLFMIGQAETDPIDNADGLIGSLWAQVIANDTTLAAPALDFQRELKHSQFIRTLIHDRHVTAAHDISDGGALVAVAEMLLAGDNDSIGANLTLPAAYKNRQKQAHAQKIAWAFGEGQARFIIASHKPAAVMRAAKKAGVAVQNIGSTTDDKHLTCGAGDSILVTEMAKAWRECLPNLAQTGGKEDTHAHVG